MVYFLFAPDLWSRVRCAVLCSALPSGKNRNHAHVFVAPGCGAAGVHTCIDLNGNALALVYQWIAFGVLSGLQSEQL